MNGCPEYCNCCKKIKKTQKKGNLQKNRKQMALSSRKYGEINASESKKSTEV